MATTYHDWASQGTDEARLTRLRLYMGELQAMIGPEVSHSGGSRSNASIQAELVSLREQETKLERRVRSSPRTLRINRR